MPESMRIVFDVKQDLLANKNENNDIWDELGKYCQTNFFFFPSSKNTGRIRLLGPYYKTSRIYIEPELNLSSLLSQEEFKNLISGDEKVKEKLTKALVVTNFKNNRKIVEQNTQQKVSTLLSKIVDNNQWQYCTLFNSFSHNDNKILITPITSSLISNIKIELNKENRKLHGIYAHDLIFTTTQDQVTNRNPFLNGKPNLTISIGASSILPKEAIHLIRTQGLFDIPKVIKYNNNNNAKKMSGYFYMIKDLNFKAPEEFTKNLMEEEKNIRQKQNIDDLLNYDQELLPKEAIEDRDDINNPIANMEIE